MNVRHLSSLNLGDNLVKRDKCFSRLCFRSVSPDKL